MNSKLNVCLFTLLIHGQFHSVDYTYLYFSYKYCIHAGSYNVYKLLAIVEIDMPTFIFMFTKKHRKSAYKLTQISRVVPIS